MIPDDNATARDGDDLEGGEFAQDSTTSDSNAGSADADPAVEIDEELLEAELGEFDAPIDDDDLDDLDEQLLDADEDEDEDDLEISLLQALGIDLDAPDSDGVEFDLGVGIDDDSVDDEVAA